MNNKYKISVNDNQNASTPLGRFMLANAFHEAPAHRAMEVVKYVESESPTAILGSQWKRSKLTAIAKVGVLVIADPEKMSGVLVYIAKQHTHEEQFEEIGQLQFDGEIGRTIGRVIKSLMSLNLPYFDDLMVLEDDDFEEGTDNEIQKSETDPD